MPKHLLDRDEFDSHYEDRVLAPARARGTLPPAGIFLAPDGWRAAFLGSPEARALREAGALPVASVTFDGAPVPAATGGGVGAFRPGGLVPHPVP